MILKLPSDYIEISSSETEEKVLINLRINKIRSLNIVYDQKMVAKKSKKTNKKEPSIFQILPFINKDLIDPMTLMWMPADQLRSMLPLIMNTDSMNPLTMAMMTNFLKDADVEETIRTYLDICTIPIKNGHTTGSKTITNRIPYPSKEDAMADYVELRNIMIEFDERMNNIIRRPAPSFKPSDFRM